MPFTCSPSRRRRGASASSCGGRIRSLFVALCFYWISFLSSDNHNCFVHGQEARGNRGLLFGGLRRLQQGRPDMAARLVQPTEQMAAEGPAAAGAASSSAAAAKRFIKSIVNRLRNLDVAQVHRGINHHLDWSDLVILGALGWLTEPMVRLMYRLINREAFLEDNDEDAKSDATNENRAASTGWQPTFSLVNEANYKQTWLFRISSAIGQVGRVISLVYVTDLCTIILNKVIGFALPPNLNRRLAQLIYAVFGALKVRQAKNWWLRSWFHTPTSSATLKGRERVIEMLSDGGIAFFLMFVIQDIFSIRNVGRGFQSLFAIGGLSGIMISLASKDLAQMMLSGFVIRSSDKYIEGETIRLGDGTSGTILHMGALEMHIRGGDGVVTRIPNVQIVNQRVQTLSRLTESQIKQNLSFRYDDIDKIPSILRSIEEEIKRTCDETPEHHLMSVRALWTEYKEDHLEAVVSAQFALNPTGQQYSETKHVMLQAIARAVKKNGVEFAIPTSICRTEDASK